jgi:2-dehydropantoate 2-reductase
VDFINGAVVKYGERLGVETPYNRAVYLIVKALETSCGF